MHYPTIDRLSKEIRTTKARLGVVQLPFFLVSDEEWDRCAIEHIGGPWLGKLMICGVPLRRRVSARGHDWMH